MMDISKTIRRIRGRDTVAGIMSQFTKAIDQLKTLASEETLEAERCAAEAETLRQAAMEAEGDRVAAERRAAEARSMASKLERTFS